MKHHHHKFFKAFLILYAGVLIFHAIELPFLNPLVIIGLIAGLSLALISHSYHGKIALFLLMIHMGVDMINHGLYFQTYTLQDYLFGILHLGMDAVFLYEESVTHTKNPRRTLLITGILLFGVFIISKTIGLEIPENTHEPIEALVMSGILGCVIYHFWNKKKHVH